MCNIDWDIVQKFVHTLVWPGLVLGLFLTFKKQLTNLINRISNESANIEIGGLFKAQLTQIEEIKKTINTGTPLSSEQTQRLVSTTVTIQVEGIKLLGEEYLNSSFDQRRIIESNIKEFIIGLTIDDIGSLLISTHTGHRIAAAIALEPILQRNNIDPSANVVVKNFIIKAIDDDNSFLRHEAIQLVFQSSILTEELKEKLTKKRLTETNHTIKAILNMYYLI
ncbi:hypothetical protein [Solitalea koreensis]|uniref:HEAT repeat-containing protein n=1 Tax=Solitalea koreensis TaxID=543615 RepID=A0A521E884_9SPHI|nr:hypothetical protein [Solitalea koreensis]SMO79641.1 hypothetical protein SAMN06265350_1125 [Solitalea koreensis]